jgi:hypothetical protein
MNRIVPFDVDYKFLKRLDTASLLVLAISVLIPLSTFVMDSGDTIANQKLKHIIILSLNIANCIFIVAYFLMDLAFGYLFQEAEIKRRNDFIDNSLSTQTSEKKSEGYFSNDSTPPSILKMGINCFENSFFTKNALASMINPAVGVSCLILFLYLLFAFCGSTNFLIALFQLVLPFTLIQKTLRLFVLKKKVEGVYNQFQTIFSSTHGENQANLILHNVLYYETALARGAILLDSNFFTKNNDRLSSEWGEIKKRFNLPV